ncbi:MAG: starvation-sensing protein RspA [Armatimonadetes bacterium]|nr:starvation-sensing protein RspA [Armatimonadota bacterium]
MAKPITIQDVKVILTAPAGIRLVVVKVITSEPGLYGLGCATFTQRHHAVAAAIEGHLKPYLVGAKVDQITGAYGDRDPSEGATGRDARRIEDLWQQMMVHSYWRNGPVLNNAVSGVDMALWDINGKRAGMPVYQLLGGKCREAAAVYRHADGRDPLQVEDNVRKFWEQGIRYIRVQMGGYGGKADTIKVPEGSPSGAYYDPKAYARQMPKMIEHIRNTVGWEVELLHDIHERLRPFDAVNFAKAVEPYKLFFLEDALAPEDIEWFRVIRNQCATPLAMGELFVHPNEWVPLVKDRLIDFMRMHISAIGGITPAKKAAALGEYFGVMTAWHGPGDVSPVGHAANLHLDLACPNFGIQEWSAFNDTVREVFPGTPVLRDGYLYLADPDAPGIGVDIDEELAAKFPPKDGVEQWTQTRAPDGTPMRP